MVGYSEKKKKIFPYYIRCSVGVVVQEVGGVVRNVSTDKTSEEHAVSLVPEAEVAADVPEEECKPIGERRGERQSRGVVRGQMVQAVREEVENVAAVSLRLR